MALILVVDDDPAIRESVGELLRAEDHHVVECHDGIGAMREVQATPPDLILLDLSMPGLSGESIAAMLKADEATRFIPIIILTGENDSNTQCRLLELGAEEFLAKPFSRLHLLARIRSLLRVKSLNDQLLHAFRSVEAMESMSMEVIRRVADDPQNPGDLLEISLGHCISGAMGRGAPTHLFFARENNGDGELEVRTFWQKQGSDLRRETGSVSKRRFLEILAPYRQTEGAYWAEAAAPAVLELLWGSLPKSAIIAGVLERGIWLFAGGYTRPVGVHDTRWLASMARQYKLFGVHLEQVAATESAFVYVMEALARAAEVHDGGTGAHLRRVNGYSGLLARSLGCPEAFVRKISQSAMMHDVGKIQISREILLKPGPLSDAEMALVKQHPESGAKILGNSPRLAMAREIALCHHERWDGTGYPRGLIGEEIPLSARIASLADVYDALRTARPYKNPIPHQEALSILAEGDVKMRRDHFDPACLEAFLKLDTKLDEVFAEGQGAA
jgi:response regulator RpfG family c-di-GMP phosphodiesterase